MPMALYLHFRLAASLTSPTILFMFQHVRSPLINSFLTLRFSANGMIFLVTILSLHYGSSLQ
ncbi:hypothetical protein B0J11DRAFT_87661 [Dendryphion nanum]|uniref:Uncharacterized protein n=1 Tax=Dendryphion nanum TaxID=256645 RepID=A0A9P9IFV1_9PLEO|nr:hypothetical protein B0J11DRAFT_87661 [Dendryphion nanum]